MKTRACFFSALVALACTVPAAQVKVTDQVTTSEVIPLGINFGGHTYYNPPKLKILYQENFEGTDYRQCHQGLLEADGLTTEYASRKTVDRWWGKLGLGEAFYTGAKVTVLSGPAKGQMAVIKGTAWQEYDRYGKGAEPFLKFLFEKPLNLAGEPVKGAGILVEVNRRGEGCTGQEYGFWMGKGASLSSDADPAGFGKSCLLLDADKGDAFYRTPTCWHRFLDNNGNWIVRFKARCGAQGGTLTLKTEGGSGGNRQIDLTPEWKEYTVTVDVSGFKDSGDERSGMVWFIFSAPSGQVLLDDIQTRKNEPFRNPTVFRDDFVESLRALKPGILRKLIMGGAMRDFLEPPLRSCRVENSITQPVGPISLRDPDPYGLGEMLALAEELDTEAWFNIPGTLYPEEMTLLMEYLGGPVTTEGGKLRAEHGHPEPWTKTLKKIYIEPGNEAWNTMLNFLAGGYNGPDYWQELFTRVKASPYYSTNVICMAAGQNYSSAMSKQILADTPAADRYAIAPYQIHGLRAADLSNWPDKKDFFRWALAYPFYNLKYNMPKQGDVSKTAGKEFAVYEANWHITGDDVRPNTPGHTPQTLEWVNRFVTSVPAALGHYNHLLALMRDYHIRAQCHFTFEGNYHEVRLWGSVLNYKQGEERLRPSGLAFGMINDAVFGDMISAEVPDAPVFRATGPDIGGQRKQVATVENPALTAYAFKDSGRRSLILFNMDLEQPHEVKLAVPSGGKAQTALLAPAQYDCNNEPEGGAPSVAVQTGMLELKDGTAVTLPPASLMTLIWEE